MCSRVSVFPGISYLTSLALQFLPMVMVLPSQACDNVTRQRLEKHSVLRTWEALSKPSVLLLYTRSGTAVTGVGMWW